MKYNKGFVGIGAIIAIIAILVVGGVVYFATKTSTPTSQPQTPQASNNSKGGPILTQSQAETLVHQTWSDCSQGDCGDVTVTVTQNNSGQYVVTAIFTELSDATSQTKRVSIATYQNGTWTLGQPTVTRMCHRGNADGTTGWTSGLCI